MLEYIPRDTSILPSKRFIQINGDTEVYLDCYFFNLNFEPFSSNLQSNEFIAFYSPNFPSSFFNKRGDETVEYKWLVIQRIKHKFYAYYYAGVIREIEYAYGVGLNTNHPISMVFGGSPEKIVLKKKDLSQVESFEKRLSENWFNIILTHDQRLWKVNQSYYTIKDNHILMLAEGDLILELKNALWNSQLKN